jgi:3-hydroxybutyrate dehydrogenase
MNCTRSCDRVVPITDSTGGIKLGLARVFAREGANLVLHGFGDHREIEGIRDRFAAFAFCLCAEHARSITGAANPSDGGWVAR